MSSLKNNEIRVMVSALAGGEQYENVGVVADYGDDVPLEGRAEDVIALLSMAATVALREAGVSRYTAANILQYALDNAYAKEDVNA